MPTKAGLTDIKVSTELEVYPIIKKIALSCVETTRNKCWEIVEGAHVCVERGLTEAATKGVFDKAFLEACGGDPKSNEYLTWRPVATKAIKIALNVQRDKLAKMRKLGGRGFNDIYNSLKKTKVMDARPGGNGKSKAEIELSDWKDIAKDGGPMAEDAKKNIARLEAHIAKANEATNQAKAEREGKQGWSDPNISGKKDVDVLYNELEALLTDDKKFGKLIDRFIKLSATAALTKERMKDLIEAYFNSNKDSAIELVNYLLTEDEWIMEAAMEFFSTEKNQAKLTQWVGGVNHKLDDETEQDMKRIKATNKKKLVGKKRG
jgi:hypothetical protein